MSKVVWQVVKCQYCERAGEEVALEARVVFPGDYLPDQPPRVLEYRCSHGLSCNTLDKATCVWAGTLPTYDPFFA